MTASVLEMIGELGFGEVRSGTILEETAFHEEASAALAAFREFGGKGWLCLAGSPGILILPRDASEIPEEGWPVSGELSNVASGLRLSRSDGKWSVTTLTEKPDGDGILLKRTLIRRDGPGTLAYEVGCRCEDRAGLAEWRPYSYRFAGFEGGER